MTSVRTTGRGGCAIFARDALLGAMLASMLSPHGGSVCSLNTAHRRRGILRGERDDGAGLAFFCGECEEPMNLTTTAQLQPNALQDDNMPMHSPLSRADDAGPLFTLFMPVSFALVVLVVSWLSIISFQ